MHIIEIAQAGIISDAPPLSYYLIRVFSFVLSLVAALAIIMSVVAGVRYLFIAGDQKNVESAKKAMQAVAVGVMMALGSFVLIKFLGSFLEK